VFGGLVEVSRGHDHGKGCNGAIIVTADHGEMWQTLDLRRPASFQIAAIRH
jgi:hypothetical protein